MQSLSNQVYSANQFILPNQYSMSSNTPLPPGWHELIDSSSGRMYYSNDITKTTQWEDPRLNNQTYQSTPSNQPQNPINNFITSMANMAIKSIADPNMQTGNPLDSFQQGAKIQILHAKNNWAIDHLFIVQKSAQSDGTYHLADANRPEGHLRVTQDGTIDYNGGRGPYATWKVEVNPNGTISLACAAHFGKKNLAGGNNWYLGFDTTGHLIGKSGNDEYGQLKIVVVQPGQANNNNLGNFNIKNMLSNINTGQMINNVITTTTSQEIPYKDPLTPNDKKTFYEKGYIIIKNAVPRELIDEALRDINYFMGTSSYKVPDDDTKLFFPPEICTGPNAANLLNQSTAFNAAKSLFGENNFVKTVRYAQVALRFPKKKEAMNPLKTKIFDFFSWHIDGMEKVFGGENHPFTLLLGIALSDQTKPDCGNLRVYPGSHIKMQEPYKRAIAVQSPLDMKAVDVGEPVQVLLAPGDIILAHQMLAHGVGINQSPNIRYQIYFRLAHKEHSRLKPLMIDNMWTEFEGLQNIVH